MVEADFGASSDADEFDPIHPPDLFHTRPAEVWTEKLRQCLQDPLERFSIPPGASKRRDSNLNEFSGSNPLSIQCTEPFYPGPQTKSFMPMSASLVPFSTIDNSETPRSAPAAPAALLSLKHLRCSHFLALALTFLSWYGAPGKAQAQSYLIDFGSNQQTFDPNPAWNNLLTSIGTTDSGTLFGLVTTDSTASLIDLQMIARFNGENTNGTTASTLFPTTATGDSLFGNTELFNNLTNVFPKFKLTNLDPTKVYNFTFYASRTGVGDVRETGYTVAGGISGFAALNVANNVDNVARVSSITPDSSHEILISLAPTANNNNANHFTYLGVLRMDVVPEPSSVLMLASGMGVVAMMRRPSRLNADR